MRVSGSKGIEPQRAQLREVNEHTARLLGGDEIVSLFCECASGYCLDQVSMRQSQFEAIRRDGRFVLAPGHGI